MSCAGDIRRRDGIRSACGSSSPRPAMCCNRPCMRGEDEPMSLADLLVQPVLVISQQLDGDLDEYGNDVPSDDPVSTVGFLERGRRMGFTPAEREGYIEDSVWLLVLPADTPIQAEDLVVVDGLTYSVSGPP